MLKNSKKAREEGIGKKTSPFGLHLIKTRLYAQGTIVMCVFAGFCNHNYK